MIKIWVHIYDESNSDNNTLVDKKQNCPITMTVNTFTIIRKKDNTQKAIAWATKTYQVTIPAPLVTPIVLPMHLNSGLGFSGVRVARSLVSCVMFFRSLFVLFSSGHCVVCHSIYGFWLQLWCLQALFKNVVTSHIQW
jgi:hypothetical protein